MHTIRGRLTAWYAVALAATMLVFAAVVFLVQRREAYAELDARAQLESDLIAAALTEAYLARGRLVGSDSRTGRNVLSSDVLPFLEGIPGFVVVFGPEADPLHVSAEARALPYESIVRLVVTPILQSETGASFGVVDLGSQVGEIRYYVRPVSSAGPRIAGVLSGASTSAAEAWPRRLLVAMLLVSPIILSISMLIGYLLAGRTLRPVDQIVDEVEAISDGRSLHKRLAPLDTGDELARLTSTLNAMLIRLERSFTSLHRFTADASHELKTPLTVLRSGIERAITHPQLTPDVLQDLEETLREVNRMAEILDALLTLARADEGRAPLHLEDLDLRDLLAEIAETGGLLGEQATIDVTVAMPDQPIPVAVDHARVRQLLMNLLTNAIKYTPAGGKVTIRSEVSDKEVAITVSDTGIGIAPGDLHNIFDRFWRADPARSRTGVRPGVGLGLAISKWIAEAHGGSIEVQSRRDRGTTFVVTLPMAVGESPTGEVAVT
jgi:signal transduction histidine kinase